MGSDGRSSLAFKYNVICYYDGAKKIEATDDTFKDAGKVGLWTKADSVTYFDDLRVTVQ